MAMKLKTGADLCNMQLIRACIWNSESDPTEWASGLIYFNSRKDGTNTANRLRYRDNNDWRSLATMDDLEKAVGGESNLGQRVATLEAMLNPENVEGVLDSWDEIREFLASVEGDLNLMELLNDKLSISKGGEVKGSITISTARWANQLILNGEGTSPGIRFYVDGVQSGLISCNSAKNLLFTPSGATADYVVIHAGNYANTTDKRYLKLEGGGTITISTINSFVIKRSTNNAAAIRYENAEKLLGYIGIDDASKPSYYDVALNKYTLIHSGNIGEYKAGSAERSYLWEAKTNKQIEGGAMKYWQRGCASYAYTIANNSEGIFPTTSYANAILTFSRHSDSDTYSQIGLSSNGNIYYRLIISGTTNDWKTIAFTDSDITGNAATATKLKTPVTIWGQSFDGSANIDGDLYIGRKNIIATQPDGTAQYVLNVGNDGGLYLGYGTATNSKSTRIDGNIVYLRYGTSHTNGLILNESGNVGIGTTDPQAKLHVYGDSEQGYALKVSGHTYLTTGLDLYSGNINMPTEYGLLYAGNEVLYKKTDGPLRFGYCQGWTGQSTYISGANIIFNYEGSGESEVMRMTNTGLVLAQNKTLKIGDATISWDADAKAIKVDSNLYSTKQISAGGEAEDGSVGGGKGGLKYTMTFSGDDNRRTWSVNHGFSTNEVHVSVYQKDTMSNAEKWDLIITDVSISNLDSVDVGFGIAPTYNEEFKVVVIA